MFEYQQLYGVKYGMDKANRLRHHQTLMTHAMMFTGVNVLPDNQVNRWRVENSWGDANGKKGEHLDFDTFDIYSKYIDKLLEIIFCTLLPKGFYCMNDNWFNEHMFEIAVPASYLTDSMRSELAEGIPAVLPAWDPMGSLATEGAQLSDL